MIACDSGCAGIGAAGWPAAQRKEMSIDAAQWAEIEGEGGGISAEVAGDRRGKRVHDFVEGGG